MNLVKGSGNAAITIEYIDGTTEIWHVPPNESMRVGAWLDENFGPADEAEE